MTSPAPSLTLYAETSAVLRVVLEGDKSLGTILAGATRLVTSTLTFVEADRGLRRVRAERRLDTRQFTRGERWLARFARACDAMPLTDAVLDRAKRDCPVEPVRTLDALHLASIRLWDERIGEITVASTDQRVRANAAAWGFTLVPP
jgi:hypothetical protein